MSSLFVYGTLMNDEVLNAVVLGEFKKQVATLHHYRRVSVLNAAYPAIYPHANSEVVGQIIHNLKPDQVAALDHYESDTYQRLPVSVLTDEGKTVSCDAYVFKPEYLHLLSDEAWSNQEFRRTHLPNYFD